MFKVSDFKLVVAFIKKACCIKNSIFVDLPVFFEEEGGISTYHNGGLYIGKPKILGDTLSRVLIAYFKYFEKITGKRLFEDKDSYDTLFLHVINFFRFLCFSQNSFLEAKADEPIAMRLYQKPLVWLLMKDIIVPAYSLKSFDNIKIIEASSPFVDVAYYVTNDEYKKYNQGNEELDEPFVFVNNDIEYKPYSDAHLFLETIKSTGEAERGVICDILTSSLKDKLIGAIELEYKTDKKINDFLLCLMTISDYENKSEELIYSGNMEKQAQHAHNPYINISDTWWFLGLIEKMLEPARGPDWDTYQILNPYFEGIWNNIEQERKKRGREGLTYEALLRIKDGETDIDDVYVIEKALKSNRVW